MRTTENLQGIVGSSGAVNVPVQMPSAPHQSSGEHVVSGDQVEHDPEDLEGVQHVEVEARQNDVAPLEDPPLLQCPRLIMIMVFAPDPLYITDLLVLGPLATVTAAFTLLMYLTLGLSFNY
ncbi:hypothetical protein SUGI_0147790 [Cryptomeria japonica]|nr:hypothetical protein SUGI_0147790 [Cryptomeria japonica]